MTQDKQAKRAARELAAREGISYAAARRRLAAPAPVPALEDESGREVVASLAELETRPLRGGWRQWVAAARTARTRLVDIHEHDQDERREREHQAIEGGYVRTVHHLVTCAATGEDPAQVSSPPPEEVDYVLPDALADSAPRVLVDASRRARRAVGAREYLEEIDKHRPEDRPDEDEIEEWADLAADDAALDYADAAALALCGPWVGWLPQEVPAPVWAPRLWRCHHCGATGAGKEAEKGPYVLADGSAYLRRHCESCLPAPRSERFPAGWRWGDAKPSEWEHFDREDWERGRALVAAVDRGELAVVPTDLYRCSVCGQAWQVDPRVRLPCGVLYDRTNDLFEHPCPGCVETMSEEELGHAHYQRFRKL